MEHQLASGHEPFIANSTQVSSITNMHLDMHNQVIFLGKTLRTYLTNVGFNTEVNFLMAVQISFPVERRPTITTREVFDAFVRQLVYAQVAQLCVSFTTYRTHIRSFTSVCSNVLF